MMTDGQHDGEDNDEALWRLLGRAEQPKLVSPYFARRVLREVAALGETQPPARETSPWLGRLWQACRRAPGMSFAGAMAAVALTVVGGRNFLPTHPPSTAAPLIVSRSEPVPAVPENVDPPDVQVDNGVVALTPAVPTAEPIVTAQDVEVIADLDNVLSREESRLWTEDDNTARF